jgi:hypothetical protein
MQSRNAKQYSAKKMAINERIQLWRNNWLKKRKKCKNFNKIFTEFVKED